LGIDFFGDLDCRGKVISPRDDFGLSPTTHNLLEIARSLDCQGLVYGAGPENHGPSLKHWEERCLLLGNGPGALAQARDPYILRETLKQIGADMPTFHTPQKPPVPGNWLLKPLFQGGGHGIIKLPIREAEAMRVLSRLDEPERYIVQEYLNGIPGSVTFLADGLSAMLVGSSSQLTQEASEHSPFRYLGNVVPLPPTYPAFWEDMAKIANHLTVTFGLKGLNTLDFILTEDGAKVLELNPRWSGSVELIEACLGQSLFLAHLNACEGRLPDSAQWEKTAAARPPRFYGKKILYAQTSFTVKSYKEGWQALYNRGVRDIPKPGGDIQAGEPICTVLAQGRSEKECKLLLEEKDALVREFYIKE